MIDATKLQVNNLVRCLVSNDAGIYKVIVPFAGWQKIKGQDLSERLVRIDRSTSDQFGEPYPASKIAGVKLTADLLAKIPEIKKVTTEVSSKNGKLYELALNENGRGTLPLSFALNGKYFEAVLFPYRTTPYKFLHEIQNIYSSLTDNELTINL